MVITIQEFIYSYWALMSLVPTMVVLYSCIQICYSKYVLDGLRPDFDECMFIFLLTTHTQGVGMMLLALIYVGLSHYKLVGMGLALFLLSLAWILNSAYTSRRKLVFMKKLRGKL